MENKRTKIIYGFYSEYGTLIYRNAYEPTDLDDYNRVMALFKEQPEKYKLVNVEYGFEMRGEAR